jgi:hypothetical protein
MDLQLVVESGHEVCPWGDAVGVEPFLGRQLFALFEGFVHGVLWKGVGKGLAVCISPNVCPESRDSLLLGLLGLE